MKANAPEKIYISPSDLAGIDYDEEWLEYPCGNNNIEYTRTDAFIEKVAIWLNKCFITHDEYGVISTQFDTEEEMLDDFKEYMKGE